MAAPAPKQPKQPELKINILKPQGMPQQLPTRFLSWMFSYGRFIVIVVEIIVLGCFAYRFKLDADLSNLKQQIDTEVKKIDNNATNEALIKQTQQKLQLIKDTGNHNPAWDKFLKDVADRTPKGVVLTSFVIDHAQNSSSLSFKITGQTSSYLDVSGFVNSLSGKNLPDDQKIFTNVDLQNFSLEEGVLSFIISGDAK